MSWKAATSLRIAVLDGGFEARLKFGGGEGSRLLSAASRSIA